MGKLHVVFIEDDYATNVYNKIIVKKSDLFESSHFFDNVKEALDVVLSQTLLIDLFFVDINLPVMDGWDFVEALQNEEQKGLIKQVPIIMLTTSLNSFDAQKSKQYDLVKDSLEKPLTIEKIKNTLAVLYGDQNNM